MEIIDYLDKETIWKFVRSYAFPGAKDKNDLTEDNALEYFITKIDEPYKIKTKFMQIHPDKLEELKAKIKKEIDEAHNKNALMYPGYLITELRIAFKNQHLENEIQKHTKPKKEEKPKYDEEQHNKALDILTNGNPLKYCLESLKQLHIGEEHILLLLLLSGVTPGLRDRRWLIHCMGVGQSGKGKTNSMEVVGKIFNNFDVNISASPKSIFYKADNETLVNNGILFFPENDCKSEEFLALERVLTDDKDIIPRHDTVINQKAVTLEIPQINVMWRNSVGTSTDDENQLNNRYYIFNVDESKEQDQAVFEHIINNFNVSQIRNDYDISVCKIITDLIKEESKQIIIPYIRGINLTAQDDRRTLKKFLRLIVAVTYFNRFQRVSSDNMIFSEVQDFEIANAIWEKINKYESSKLPEYETNILEEVSKHKEGISLNELAVILDKDLGNLSRKIEKLEQSGDIYSQKQTENGWNEEKRKSVYKTFKMLFSTKPLEKKFRYCNSDEIIKMALNDLCSLNIEELKIPEKRYCRYCMVLEVRDTEKVKELLEEMSVSHFEEINKTLFNINKKNNIYNALTKVSSQNTNLETITKPNTKPLQNHSKTQQPAEEIDMEVL